MPRHPSHDRFADFHGAVFGGVVTGRGKLDELEPASVLTRPSDQRGRARRRGFTVRGPLESEEQLRYVRARGEPIAVLRHDARDIFQLSGDRDLTSPLEQGPSRGRRRVRRVVGRELVLRDLAPNAVGQRPGEKRVLLEDQLLSDARRAERLKELDSDPVALAYARAGVKRRVALTVSSFGVAASVAATTELVATLPRSLFRALGSRYRLLAAAGPVPKHTVPVFLCWHERARRDPAVSELRALVTATLRA